MTTIAIFSGVFLVFGLVVFGIITTIHGLYLCFKKHWAFGALALIVPGFANIVSLFKLVLKKDLLK